MITFSYLDNYKIYIRFSSVSIIKRLIVYIAYKSVWALIVDNSEKYNASILMYLYICHHHEHSVIFYLYPKSLADK